MIAGIGVDAVNIQRVKKLNESFIQKYFNLKEIEEFHKLENAHEDVRAQFIASRFAAKEAYAKARGTGFCSDVVPSEICTLNMENGAPYIELSGKTKEKSGEEKIHISITHEEPLAIAMVILEEV